MRLYGILILAIAAMLPTSCKKANNNSVIPSITYGGISPNTVKSGNGKDTVFVKLILNDGDGDLGNDPNSGIHDVYLKDSRTGETNKYFFPAIPSDAIKAEKGVQIYVTIKVEAGLFLVLRPDHPTGDTLSYDIYVKDKAGNNSNTITTEPIYITP